MEPKELNPVQFKLLLLVPPRVLTREQATHLEAQLLLDQWPIMLSNVIKTHSEVESSETPLWRIKVAKDLAVQVQELAISSERINLTFNEAVITV